MPLISQDNLSFGSRKDQLNHAAAIRKVFMNCLIHLQFFIGQGKHVNSQFKQFDFTINSNSCLFS